MLISLSHSVVQALHVAQMILGHHLGAGELQLEDMDHVNILGSETEVRVRVRVGAKRFEVELGRRHDIDFEYPVKLSEGSTFIRYYFYDSSREDRLVVMNDGLPLEKCTRFRE